MLLSRGLLCLELGRLASTHAEIALGLPSESAQNARPDPTHASDCPRGDIARIGRVRETKHKNQQRPDLIRICADCARI